MTSEQQKTVTLEIWCPILILINTAILITLEDLFAIDDEILSCPKITEKRK